MPHKDADEMAKCTPLSDCPLLALHVINPSYTGGLFYCYIMDESNCHFMGIGSLLSLLFLFFFFDGKSCEQTM